MFSGTEDNRLHRIMPVYLFLSVHLLQPSIPTHSEWLLRGGIEKERESTDNSLFYLTSPEEQQYSVSFSWRTFPFSSFETELSTSHSDEDIP